MSRSQVGIYDSPTLGSHRSPPQGSIYDSPPMGARCSPPHEGNHDLPTAGSHRSPAVEEMQGTWINVDCPGEQYAVVGQHITRTDANGSRNFTFYWDTTRQQLLWGTHERLHLEHLTDGLIGWVDQRHRSRIWRWQRLPTSRPPTTPASSPSGPPWCAPPPSASWASFGMTWPSLPDPAGSAGLDGAWHGGGRLLGSSARSRSRRRSHHYRGSTQHRGAATWQDSHSSRRGSSHDDERPPSRRREREYRSDHRQHREQQHHSRHHRYYGQGHHRGSSDSQLSRGGLPSGVFDLLFREITPEDYETLLRLDEGVQKRTASADSVQKLPDAMAKEFMGESCTVCLTAFVAEDEVARMPCRHHFHRQCISRWLSECGRACPLCGKELQGTE